MLSGPPGTARVASALDRIRYVNKNLILDAAGDWYACYRLNGHTYALMSRSAKERLELTIENAIKDLDTHIKILSLVSAFRGEDYASRLKRMPHSPSMGVSPPNELLWENWCDLVGTRLAGSAPYSREFFLAVRLNASAGSVGQAGRKAARKVRHWVRRRVGAKTIFDAEELRRASEAAGRIRDRFGSSLIASDATEADIHWLVARSAHRTVGEPDVPPWWAPSRATAVGSGPGPSYEADASEYRRMIGPAVIRSRPSHLEIHHGDGTVAYQRFLSVSKMPEEGLGFPDNEWAFVTHPVDLLLDFTVTPAAKGERQRKNASRKVSEQVRYLIEGGSEVPLSLRKSEQAHARLEAEHEANRPRIDCHATLALSSATEEGLDSQTETLSQHYRRRHIQLARGHFSQLEAFSDFVPAGATRLTDYRQHMGLSTLGGSVPTAQCALGDREGFYIGNTYPDGGVVTYHPALPQLADISGACTWTGTLGSGKTVGMEVMLLYLAMAGFESLLIDPKGDSSRYRRIKEARDLVDIVEVKEGSDTRLPILSVFPDTPEGRKYTENLLKSFLIQLFQFRDPSRQNAVRLGVRNFMGREELSSVRLLRDDFLAMTRQGETYSREIREAAKDAATELDYYLVEGLAGLTLDDDPYAAEASLARSKTEAPLTVIQTTGLDLPQREKIESGDLNDKERISQAMLSVIAASAYQLTRGVRRVEFPPFKAIAFDEAWRFLYSGEGGRLLHELMREGRSRNVTPMVGSQRNRDLAIIDDLVTVRFLGRNDSEDDVRFGLKQVGVDATEETLSMFSSFGSGDFLHRDMYGQVGLMHVNPVPRRWVDQLGTTPSKKRGEAMVKLSDRTGAEAENGAATASAAGTKDGPGSRSGERGVKVGA